MDFSQIKIERRHPRPVEYARLRHQAGWPELEPSVLEKGLNNSLFAVCINYQGKMIACCRILGDGAIYFSLHDFLVDDAFSGEGIDSMLLDVIMAYIKNNASANSLIEINAPANLTDFFGKYGFRPTSKGTSGMVLQWKGN